MTPILTMIALTARVMVKISVRIIMVFPVQHLRSVCPTIASMVFVVATSAWARAKHVQRRKRAVVAMAYAAVLR
jgi:hypothetical protein